MSKRAWDSRWMVVGAGGHLIAMSKTRQRGIG